MGLKQPPPTTILQLMILRRCFDNSQFISSLFNFHLTSIRVTSYDAIIALLTDYSNRKFMADYFLSDHLL